MKFEEALELIRSGYKVARAAWKGEFYLYLKGDGERIGERYADGQNKTIDGDDFETSMHSKNLMAEDWEVVE